MFPVIFYCSGGYCVHNLFNFHNDGYLYSIHINHCTALQDPLFKSKLGPDSGVQEEILSPPPLVFGN